MSQAAADLGNLPQWDLSDLYPGIDSPELEADLKKTADAAEGFHKRLAGKLASLGGDDLATAIADYEVVEETLGRIMSFAHLYYAGNMSDPEVGRFFQTMQERVNDITTHLLFFTLEINRLEEDRLEKAFTASAKLAHYRPWLRDVRVFRPYQLSDELEQLLHEKSVSGRSAWIRLFDETMTGLRFPLDGKMLSSEEVLHLLSEKDGKLRQRAAESLSGVFAKNVRLFSLITNTLAKDKETEDKWRKLPSPSFSRHLGNQVEPSYS